MVTEASKRAARGLAKSNGIDVTAEVSADPKVLAVKVAALEKGLEQIVKMTQGNHEEIRRAFAFTDAHLWVLSRICQDIVSGSVVMKAGVPSVDLGAYYDLYNTAQREAAKTAKSTETQAAEDRDVFGGDLSNEDSERDKAAGEGEGPGEVGNDQGSAAATLPGVQEPGVASAGA